MKKVIRDGKVAVLVSPSYGAGWYTWAGTDGDESMLFDPDMVAAVEAGDYEKATAISKTKWPQVYDGGIDDLVVEWVPVGAQFPIHEYDGSETIEFYNPGSYFTA